MRSGELFQADLFGEDCGVLVGGIIERHFSGLGRCEKCGDWVKGDLDFCPHCLGTVFCYCGHCAEISTILRSIHDELYRGQVFEVILPAWKEKLNQDLEKYKKIECKNGGGVR
jgi:hypothetical protein